MNTPHDPVSLSIIIPTYNRASYVRNCLLTLRKSGLNDLEIFVADDGSTDDTAAVVAATAPHARHLELPHRGTPAPARNHGFSLSRGRYVGFLDCDDVWLPGAPAKAVALLDRYPQVDVLFGEAKVGNPEDGFASWIEMAGQAEFWKLPAALVEPGFRVLERGPFFRRMAVRNPVFIGACIMRREVFEKSGGFDANLCGAADWELWLRLATQFTYGFMSEPLGVWTQHQTNMSSNHDTMRADFCLALQSVLRKCDLPADDRAFVQDRLRYLRFSHAYLAYDQGRYAEARGRFGTLLRECGLELRAAAYWGFCALPLGLSSRLRQIKQALAGHAE